MNLPYPLARHVLTLLACSLFYPLSALAQDNNLFDGDFESGTFQGWTPSSDNGGVVILAAKGGCYATNDTTAISFNGNTRSNYAALLRSNAAGDTDSVARLRSRPFTAGNAVYFSALTEASEAASPSRAEVNFVVRIFDDNGEELAKLPYSTARIALATGCPSERRDAAFSIHSVPTHQFEGQITLEFSQHTNVAGADLFTLIDDVFSLPKGQMLISRSQPVAVAGTSVTSSGTLYLDPSLSFDPDQTPQELHYSWFINGENHIRELDFPCVLNLSSVNPGNNTATLYVDDGFHYAADTIKFVVPATHLNTNSTATDSTRFTLTAPRGGPLSPEAPSGSLLTDPRNECDIDINQTADTPLPPNNSLRINLNGNTAGDFFTDYTVSGNAIAVAGELRIDNAANNQLARAVISIQNPQLGDTLTLDADYFVIDSVTTDSTALTMTPSDDTTASVESFIRQINAVRFSYTPVGNTITTTRTIEVEIKDAHNSAQARAHIRVTN